MFEVNPKFRADDVGRYVYVASSKRLVGGKIPIYVGIVLKGSAYFRIRNPDHKMRQEFDFNAFVLHTYKGNKDLEAAVNKSYKQYPDTFVVLSEKDGYEPTDKQMAQLRINMSKGRPHHKVLAQKRRAAEALLPPKQTYIEKAVKYHPSIKFKIWPDLYQVYSIKQLSSGLVYFGKTKHSLYSRSSMRIYNPKTKFELLYRDNISDFIIDWQVLGLSKKEAKELETREIKKVSPDRCFNIIHSGYTNRQDRYPGKQIADANKKIIIEGIHATNFGRKIDVANYIKEKHKRNLGSTVYRRYDAILKEMNQDNGS